MKLTDVIRRPLITEKTTVIREDGRTLVFQVANDANKIDIKRAVEQLLGSKVESVRTSLAHGKFKRQGRYIGRRSDWKKAYVWELDAWDAVGPYGPVPVAEANPVVFADLQIGVTALYLDYELLTANVRHFEMIPGLAVRRAT